MDRILWYFADPMCSWCWGFAPVIEQLAASYRQRIPISLVVGGLRPGNTVPMDGAGRAEILHHWHEVERMSGQGFAFEGALPDGFVYDTEPACRAVVTIPTLESRPAGADAASAPGKTLAFFLRLQQAFYLQQRDITRAETLAQLATELGFDGPAFLEHWSSAEIREKTQRHFRMTRQYGVRGFPTLIAQDRHGVATLCHGYQGLEQLEPRLLAWLERSEQLQPTE